jgi:actin-related protein
VLSGGSTAMRGLAARLCQELSRLASCEVRLLESDVATPSTSVWRGGSVVCCTPALLDRLQWISREEYDDAGDAIAATKCP